MKYIITCFKLTFFFIKEKHILLQDMHFINQIFSKTKINIKLYVHMNKINKILCILFN